MECMTHTMKEGEEKIIYNNNNTTTTNNNNYFKIFFLCLPPLCMSCTPPQLSARLKNLENKSLSNLAIFLI